MSGTPGCITRAGGLRNTPSDDLASDFISEVAGDPYDVARDLT
jgi:hypothetical protein